MGQNLWLHFGVNEHPLATYFAAFFFVRRDPQPSECNYRMANWPWNYGSGSFATHSPWPRCSLRGTTEGLARMDERTAKMAQRKPEGKKQHLGWILELTWLPRHIARNGHGSKFQSYAR